MPGNLAVSLFKGSSFNVVLRTTNRYGRQETSHVMSGQEIDHSAQAAPDRIPFAGEVILKDTKESIPLSKFFKFYGPLLTPQGLSYAQTSANSDYFGVTFSSDVRFTEYNLKIPVRQAPFYQDEILDAMTTHLAFVSDNSADVNDLLKTGTDEKGKVYLFMSLPHPYTGLTIAIDEELKLFKVTQVTG